MNIIAFLVVGIIAGLVAAKLVEGRGFGPIGDMVIGIIGALVGGYLFDALDITGYGFWGSLATSIVGAVLFLMVASLFQRTPTTPVSKY